MKRFALFILIIIASRPIYAQSDSLHVWNKWCARKDTLLLFSTGNNVIQLCGGGLHASDIKLKALDKTLRIGAQEIKGDTLNVMAMPYATKGRTMRLAVLNKKTNKLIKTLVFYSADVPTPIAVVGNLRSKEELRKDILAQTTLKVIFPGSLYSYPYRVKQFTFDIHSVKGSATIPTGSFFLTPDILGEIKDAPAGTVANFTNILVTCPECDTRKLDDIAIKIK